MKYFKTKFDFIRTNVEENTNLLDLGCRNNILKKYIPLNTKYIGLDLFQNEDNGVNVVANIEDGLPFDDDTFDYIIALDLLEHLNDFQKTMEEALIKLKKGGKIIIQLPNLSYLPYRWDFLLNGRFTKTDKYQLKFNYGLDRHRWLTTMVETDEFISQFSISNECSSERIAMVSSKLKLIVRLFDLIGLKEYNYSSSVIYVIKK